MIVYPTETHKIQLLAQYQHSVPIVFYTNFQQLFNSTNLFFCPSLLCFIQYTHAFTQISLQQQSLYC